MKYIDANLLRKELQKPKNELKVGNYYLDNSEQAVGYENALNDFELLIDSLQQQLEVNLEKLGGIARHIIAVKQNVEDMRLNEDEWSLLERIGYPHKLNARKEE